MDFSNQFATQPQATHSLLHHLDLLTFHVNRELTRTCSSSQKNH